MTAVANVSTLVDTLRKHRLLEPMQLHELTTLGLQDRFDDPHALAQEMIQRQWLTEYQVHELFAGRLPGLVLGSYVIQEKLGEGPMGTAYKARHVHMRRVVTLNVIREDLLAEPAAVERFYNEIQIASQLSSPHVVHAYDAGPFGRTHFFAMEFMQGTDLGRMVADAGPLPVEKACAYVYQVTQGLQDAFEKGLVHGDLKPANLGVVGADGSNLGPLDARAVAATGLIKIRNLGLTFLQPVRGGAGPAWAEDTVDFLAPERGERLDAGDVRADLYSLGCVFYYLLSGQVPFPGGRPEDKPRRHCEEEPVPLDFLTTDVPPRVLEILKCLMAKDPEERFRTPALLAEALAPILGLEVAPRDIPPRPQMLPTPPPPPSETLEDLTPTVPTRRQPRPRSRRLVWLNLGTGTVAVLVVAALIYAVLNLRPAKPLATVSQASGDDAQAIFQALADRAGQPQVNIEALSDELRAFRVHHPGTDLTVQAALLLGQLPSPLDELDPQSFRPDAATVGIPAGVVAVLGESRQRHWGTANCLAFHPDGKRLLSGGGDGTLRVWDAETMNELDAIPAQGGEPIKLVFTADGINLASSSTDSMIRLWNAGLDPPANKIIIRLARPTAAMALSPDGQTLAVANIDKNVPIIQLWQLPVEATAKPLVLIGHTGEVRDLAFAADSKTLASASADKTVRLWDLSKPVPVQQALLERHTLPVQAVAFSPDGQELASGGDDKTVRLWQVATGLPLQPDQLPNQTVEVTALAFHRDGTRVASGGKDGNLRVWNWSAGKPAGEPVVLRGQREAVRALAFAADKPLLAAASNDQTVRLWHLTKDGWQPRHRLRDGPTFVRAVALAPDGKTLVLSGSDGTMRVWQLAGGKPVEQPVLPAPGAPIYSLAFDPGGWLLASAHQDQKVRLWKKTPERLEESQALEGHSNAVTQVAFSPDSKELVSVGADRMTALWPLADPALKPRILRGSAKELRAVAFSADSKMAADVNADGQVRVWKLTFLEPKVQNTLQNLGGAVQCVDFAPQGTMLATGGQDNKVRLWEMAGDKPTARLLDGHKAAVTVVRFAPDNRSLISAGINGQIIWWDLPAGTRKGEWQLPGGLQHAALAADGRHVVTANNNGTVYILRLASPDAR